MSKKILMQGIIIILDQEVITTWVMISPAPAFEIWNCLSTKMNIRDGTELVLGQSISVDISTPRLLSKHSSERA